MLKPLIILTTLALTACATQLGLRDKVDLHRQMFSQIVFAPDYDSRRKDYLRKWNSPLSIKLKDQTGKSIEKYKGTVEGQSSALEKITGLKISLATESNPANVTIQFDTLEGMQKRAASNSGYATAAQASISNSGCHAWIEKHSDHRITAARIFVIVDPSAESIQLLSGTLNSNEQLNEQLRVSQCLVKGLIKILGFVNPSDIITPSIFNSTRNLSRPTSLDLKFIKTLYNASLKPGMPRKQALQLVENLLQ